MNNTAKHDTCVLGVFMPVCWEGGVVYVESFSWVALFRCQEAAYWETGAY